ncbi:MAG: hypothetical protein R3F43_27515 [bacterium]
MASDMAFVERGRGPGLLVVPSVPRGWRGPGGISGSTAGRARWWTRRPGGGATNIPDGGGGAAGEVGGGAGVRHRHGGPAAGVSHNPAKLEAAEARFFADVVRGAGLKALAERALVLTRENLAAQLPPGTDLAACEGACEVETGRNVGADFVISGEILRLGGELRVLLKAHETAKGALVATERAAAAGPSALEAPLEAAATRLFAGLRLQDAAARLAPDEGGERLHWEQTPILTFPVDSVGCR